MDHYLKELHTDYLNTSTVLSEEFDKKEFENYAGGAERSYGSHLPQDRNARIVDIGCGQGHFLYYLMKKGFRNIYGIDIAPDQVEFCRRYITENVECADYAEWLPGKTFDVIVMNEVLEHIPKQDVIPAIKLVYESLNGNGLFIVKVPNMRNPFNLAARYIDFTHEIGFTENSLCQVLRAGGFNQIEIYPTVSEKIKHIWFHPKTCVKLLMRSFILAILRRFFEIASVHPVSGEPLNLFSKRIIAIARR